MKRTSIYLVVFLIVQALFFTFWFYHIKSKQTPTKPDDIFVDSVFSDTAVVLPDNYSQLLSNQQMMATLFQQTAAEYRALCYQAFAAARVMLESDLKDKNVNSPRAIIVDIDETLLDNSPHSAKCIEEGTSYPDFWDEWCLKASAKAVPGAVEFLNLARRYGVSIFYITNRKAHLKEATMKNLLDLGFPQVEEKNVMFRTAEASKENRRMEVAKFYHISMLIGDNLADFSNVFELKTIANRIAVTDSLNRMFGKRYIVLPNAMYGDWEGTLYDYDFSLSDSAKLAVRYKRLMSF